MILKNDWATKGVYAILDDKGVQTAKGHFSYDMAQAIWANTPFEEKHDELLQLMEKFKLCYRVPYKEDLYVSPQLLPKEKPDYYWDDHLNLIIYYEYAFMPKGMLERLIVELHDLIKDIHTMAWRKGCVFTYENTDAQVIETYGERKLEIRIKGKHCVWLSTTIQQAVDRINDSFGKQMRVKKNLPCNCSLCQTLDLPHFYTFQSLKTRKERNKRTIECDKSYEDVQVLEILEGTYQPHLTQEESIRELIKNDEVKKALDLLDKEDNNEAILLMSRFNEIERFYYLGEMNQTDWRTAQQQIKRSILHFSTRTQARAVPKKDIAKVDQQLKKIGQQLGTQEQLLNQLIAKSDTQQYELLALLKQLDANQLNLSMTYAEQVIKAVQDGMEDLVQKFPTAESIVEEWTATKAAINLAPNSQTKLKFILPLLFMQFEKEITWDGKSWFQAIRDDIQRGREGKWIDAFLKKSI